MPIKDLDNQTTRIPLELIREYPFATALWGYVRCHDCQGSGQARLSLPSIASFFNRSEKTILRWFRCGKQNGFFRRCIKEKGEIFVAYSNAAKIAFAQDIEKFSAIADCSVEQLQSPKQLAVLIAAEHAQKQSFYAVQKKNPGVKLASPESTLRDAHKKIPHSYDGGFLRNERDRKDLQSFEFPARALEGLKSRHFSAISQGTNRKLFVGSNYKTYGSNQSTIGFYSYKSDRTVRRYVKDTYRVQIFKQTDNPTEQMLVSSISAKKIGFDLTNGKEKKLFRSKDNICLRYCPNVYVTSIEFRNTRCWRRRLKNLWKPYYNRINEGQN